MTKFTEQELITLAKEPAKQVKEKLLDDDSILESRKALEKLDNEQKNKLIAKLVEISLDSKDGKNKVQAICRACMSTTGGDFLASLDTALRFQFDYEQRIKSRGLSHNPAQNLAELVKILKNYQPEQFDLIVSVLGANKPELEYQKDNNNLFGGMQLISINPNTVFNTKPSAKEETVSTNNTLG